MANKNSMFLVISTHISQSLLLTMFQSPIEHVSSGSTLDLHSCSLCMKYHLPRSSNVELSTNVISERFLATEIDISLPSPHYTFMLCRKIFIREL